MVVLLSLLKLPLMYLQPSDLPTSASDMPQLICVTGATGNQGGSVAKFLLQFPDTYRIRAVTRRPESAEATFLRELGAEVDKADLSIEAEVNEAVSGCWGVFAVTNSYDPVCSPSSFT